ncbi:MAG: hypothetical protein DMG06_05995 [Acidobacteria bacterium]|nr:MAG: hypothetical protein DMG06_05995 [Acidobacteriota bacterium]
MTTTPYSKTPLPYVALHKVSYLCRLVALGIELAAICGMDLSPVFAEDIFNTHKVVLDNQNKIIPWSVPVEKAYDHFLRLRWNFIKTKVPNCPGPAPRSSFPQYYFYCAFRDKNGTLEPDTWMNDVGEKIPNWFESARLYYAYTGDVSVMTIVKNLVDYTMAHGTSPSTFAWADFPYTTTNAGDMEFRGFTNHKKLVLHEIQVDHAGDIGLTYYRMYLYTGNTKYLTAAIHVANTLASKARVGNASQSVWPYRVVMDSGKITAEYGANWIGSYVLLDSLIKANLGHVKAYREARSRARDFILHYPMKTGYWTDGHTDTDVNSNTYKSNMSASNTTLYLLDHPEFDPDWMIHVPKLIKWTQENFVFRCAPGEPATQWGANIVGEQDGFLVKMDYQTARYAAECARWYAVSGDEAYKEKAYRSLNWVTYCNNSAGQAFESPVSKDVSNWWSDCYGEGPRMFYPAFAAVPEWAPPRENHILYSEGVLKNVSYAEGEIQYTPTDEAGTEYLRLAFAPSCITLKGIKLSLRSDLKAEGYTLRNLGSGDYAVKIRRMRAGEVAIR